jgi:hypothetical protein
MKLSGKPFVPLAIDGSSPDFLGGRDYVISLCPSATCMGTWNQVNFYSCTATTDSLNRHTISFAGGQMVLDVMIGMAGAGTGPSAFVKASGTLDGTAFQQTDYWKLVYRPEHHHFRRNFAVLFDAPIGGACGVKVENVKDAQLVQMHTINCDLSNIEARTITAVTVEGNGA